MSHRHGNNHLERGGDFAPAAGLAIAIAMVLAGGAARANGAFPDGQAVLLPRDHPQQILLATNFGLVSSDDDGKTWLYSCESSQTSGGYRYVIGPPTAGGVSGDRIFAVSSPPPGAPFTSDGACTWSQSGGAIVSPASPSFATDVFPDPVDPARVFLLTIPQDQPDLPGSVYRSTDGGATYAGPIYTPSSTGRSTMTGIEVAASAPTVYATWYEVDGSHPHLSRSSDGGETWTDRALEAQIGASKPYLAAIDPDDDKIVYLRLLAPTGAADQRESLAVTRDGGATWTIPVIVTAGSLQGFVRRHDGTAIALGQIPTATEKNPPSILYRSTDGGRTFAPESMDYHARGIAERDGTLFMATDNAIDLVALVSSTDGKKGNWTSRLRFQQISAIRGCVFAACQSSCDFLLGNAPIFPPEVCSKSSDAVGGRGGAGTATGTGGTGGKSGGCSCAVRSRDGGEGGLGLAFVVAAACLVRRRRRA